MKKQSGSAVPILIMLLALLVVWYIGAVLMNWNGVSDALKLKGVAGYSWTDVLVGTMNQQKPLLPAPHQLVTELWNTVIVLPPTSKKSLLYHGWITLSATLLGFAFGTVIGILLAVFIVHNRAADRSLMPWIIASQTIPILAIAPIIVIIAYNALTGDNPLAHLLRLDADTARLAGKAVISMYLSFFPVVVGMVKGFRSPEQIQLDLMRTYSASRAEVFFKLRWPIAIPYLFTSIKVGVAASLVGAIVGELPTGGGTGLGARLLAGSYYGQTIQIWSSLTVAAVLAGTLVIVVGGIERVVVGRMGARPA